MPINEVWVTLSGDLHSIRDEGSRVSLNRRVLPDKSVRVEALA